MTFGNKKMIKDIIKKVVLSFTLSVVITVCIDVFDSTGFISFFDNKHYDFFTNCVDKRIKDNNTVIVAIDDKTLIAMKDEPLVFWGPHFAKAIDVLNSKGAKAIGLDFLFTVSAESWLKKIGVSADGVSRTYDIPMRKALGSGTVVLASILAYSDDGRFEKMIPPFEYWAIMPGLMNDIGIANLSYDQDGVCRSFDIGYGFKDPPNFSFSSALVMKYLTRSGDKKRAELLEKKMRQVNELRIGFVGPPGTIKRISFLDLFEDGTSRSEKLDLIKDKIVIIAEENSGSQDIHQTPYALNLPGFTPRMMTGAELHANIIESLVSERYPVELDATIKIFIFYFTILLVSIVCQFMRPWQGAGLSLLIIILFNFISFQLFRNNLILKSAGVELSTACIFLFFFAIRYSGSEMSRKKLKVLFGRYVSDEVVDILASAGMEPELGGSLKEVTVLFSDIRGFTSISESLGPEETVEMLNEYFGRISTVIFGNAGTIDKFIGDAVMAIFGAPVNIPDHASKALSTAMQMNEIADHFNEWIDKRFTGRSLPRFRIGVGVHTGKAIIGNIGSPQKLDYTAIGDTVNTASRIEGVTKDFGWTVALSSTTLESLKNNNCAFLDYFNFGEAKEVLLKGKSSKIIVYELKQSTKRL